MGQFWGDRLTKCDNTTLVVYTLDAFEPDILTHGGPSAYPPDRSRAVLPSSIYLGWTDESVDDIMADALRTSAATLVEAGIRDGQDLANAAPYVNYALFGTPLKRMYGDHLERLREIRKKYDPRGVMLLAGGWKF
jgi:Berberine and berberine like